MSAKKECPREKKRTRIRQELYRMSDREFRRRCADHIRAIRYLRLRNQELQFLNSFLRMQRAVAERSVLKAEDNHIIGEIKGKILPKDWENRIEHNTTERTNTHACMFSFNHATCKRIMLHMYSTYIISVPYMRHFQVKCFLWNTQDKSIYKLRKGIFSVDASAYPQ